MDAMSAGKGDTYRKVDYKKWSENYDEIFRKKSVFDMSVEEYMKHLMEENEDCCPECLGSGWISEAGMFSAKIRCENCEGGKL